MMEYQQFGDVIRDVVSDQFGWKASLRQGVIRCEHEGKVYHQEDSHDSAHQMRGIMFAVLAEEFTAGTGERCLVMYDFGPDLFSFAFPEQDPGWYKLYDDSMVIHDTDRAAPAWVAPLRKAMREGAKA